MPETIVLTSEQALMLEHALYDHAAKLQERRNKALELAEKVRKSILEDGWIEIHEGPGGRLNTL